MLVQVHQLKKQGFSISAIAKKLEISRNTVYKYLNMSFEEATEWANSLGTRSRKLDPFQDLLLSSLKEHSDLSSSQIEDWLKERHPALEGWKYDSQYVSELRDIHHIPKIPHIRSHEAVEELPMGKQAQVDWGETKVKSAENKEVKLYFISFSPLSLTVQICHMAGQALYYPGHHPVS